MELPPKSFGNISIKPGLLRVFAAQSAPLTFPAGLTRRVCFSRGKRGYGLFRRFAPVSYFTTRRRHLVYSSPSGFRQTGRAPDGPEGLYETVPEW